MLSKGEVVLLTHLERRQNERPSVQEVAAELGWSEGYASRTISGLEAREFVRTERTGGRRVVSTIPVRPVELLGSLASEFDHVDFPDLLAGSSLQILYYMDRPRTAAELTEACGVGRTTVYRRLNALQRVGIVGKDHSHYELNEPFSSLSTVARSIAHHDHRREATRQTAGVTLIWESHDECLFACDTAVSDPAFVRTGPAAFEAFDIPLLTRDRFHYVRSERLATLTPADLLCHTLLIDDGSRYRSYCLLLMTSRDVDRAMLTERAAYYDRTAAIDLQRLLTQLTRYLETNGAVTNDRLPAWDEFERTAADYGITV